MQDLHVLLRDIHQAVENITDPMEASETIKKLTHPLLETADPRTKETLLQLMEQAEMLHEYQTDMIRFRDSITQNTTEQSIRENILDLLGSLELGLFQQ